MKYPSGSVTRRITFSSDSSLAIIEMNNFKPIAVLNLTDFQIVYQYSMVCSGIVDAAYFIGSSNSLMIIFGKTCTELVDLVTNNSY